MAFTTADLDGTTKMTPSRAEKSANYPPRTEIVNFTLTSTRKAVSTLVTIPEGWRIASARMGLVDDEFTDGISYRIHKADEAAGVTSFGVGTGITQEISVAGWFSDLWVSKSGANDAAWIMVQIKPEQ